MRFNYSAKLRILIYSANILGRNKRVWAVYKLLCYFYNKHDYQMRKMERKLMILSE